MTSAPGGGVNCNFGVGHGYVARAGLEIQRHGLAQLVLEHHAAQFRSGAAEAELRLAEIGIAALGDHTHPIQIVALAVGAHLEDIR